MSDARKDIKEKFSKIRELSGQKGQYRALDGGLDELIDALNDLIQQAGDKSETERAEKAISDLQTAREDEFSKVKLAEDEARGRGATVSKDRIYSRQLDSAISSVETAISSFL